MAEISFSNAFRKGLHLVSKNLFPTKKKATLSEYAHAMLIFSTIVTIASCIPVLGIIVDLICMFLIIGWMIARMHDIDRSGWWVLVPLINAFLILQPSDKNSTWEKLIGAFEDEDKWDDESAKPRVNNDEDDKIQDKELNDAETELDKMLNG